MIPQTDHPRHPPERDAQRLADAGHRYLAALLEIEEAREGLRDAAHDYGLDFGEVSDHYADAIVRGDHGAAVGIAALCTAIGPDSRTRTTWYGRLLALTLPV